MQTRSASADPGVQTSETSPLDAVIRQITEISTLPQIAFQVMEVARAPDAGVMDLKRVVESDPALSARVIRMVNSAAYGMRTTVSNLHQAISYLGFNQVRNLAMTASVSEIFRDSSAIGAYSRTGLWRHLVSVGIAARLVARRRQLANFEDAFLAGLLHDIGIVLIDQHAHRDFQRLMTSLDPQRTLCENERAVLGFDHCMLGDRIAGQWRFPVVAHAAIRFHHNSERYKGDGGDLVRCVEIANVICSLKGLTSVGVKLVRPPLAAFQAFGFGKEDVMVLADDLEREFAQSESLFEL